MKSEKVKITEIHGNESNPRVIKDDKFKKLVKSIQDFPRMLEIRPIVVDENNIVLGGNMRLKACIEAGLKEVHIVRANDLTEEQKQEFIIKDNVGFGEWDWDQLANEWDSEMLSDWGLEVPVYADDISLDGFFEESPEHEKDEKFKIVLEYSEEDFADITELLKKHSGTKEEIFYNLLSK